MQHNKNFSSNQKNIWGISNTCDSSPVISKVDLQLQMEKDAPTVSSSDGSPFIPTVNTNFALLGASIFRFQRWIFQTPLRHLTCWKSEHKLKGKSL